MTEGLIPPVNKTAICRAEFERWARANGYEVVPMMSMDAYYAGRTDVAWYVWQNAWNTCIDAKGAK